MDIKPKSSHLIEAQTGGYVLDRFSYSPTASQLYQAGRRLMLYSGYDEAFGILKHESRQGRSEEAHDSYLQYLRQKSPAERDYIQQKANMFKVYEHEFKPYMGNSCMGPEGRVSKRRSLLGEGMFSKVYSLELNGQKYAVRYPWADVMPEIDNKISAALLVKDLGCIEQIVAASYSDNLTVSEFVPGRPTSLIETAHIEEIPQESFDNLYRDLLLAEERGVGFDGISDNLLYDTESSKFTMVDISLANNKIGAGRSSAWKAMYDSIRGIGEQGSKSRVSMAEKLIESMCRFKPGDTLAIERVEGIIRRG